MNVLVTGGVGFIGSHTVVELRQGRGTGVFRDNFCNSSRGYEPTYSIEAGLDEALAWYVGNGKD